MPRCERRDLRLQARQNVERCPGSVCSRELDPRRDSFALERITAPGLSGRDAPFDQRPAISPVGEIELGDDAGVGRGELRHAFGTRRSRASVASIDANDRADMKAGQQPEVGAERGQDRSGSEMPEVSITTRLNGVRAHPTARRAASA